MITGAGIGYVVARWSFECFVRHSLTYAFLVPEPFQVVVLLPSGLGHRDAVRGPGWVGQAVPDRLGIGHPLRSAGIPC